MWAVIAAVMKNEKFINHTRLSFTMLRWGALIALLALPFTFSEGAISKALIASVVPISLGWLATLVMAWRTHKLHWFTLSFIIITVTPRFTGLYDPGLPNPHVFQWFCYLLIIAGSPLLLFQEYILGLSGIKTEG